MNNAIFGLCFVLLVFNVNDIECKGGRGGGGRGHSSHGHSSHGGHHSGGGGWSFFGWGKSSSSSGSHTYPKSTGYSGHGTGGAHTYPKSHGLSGSGGGWSHYRPSRPTYYTSPQYVYVTQYRETHSPYSNLLTGLTMYNLGRSHSYHNHYYNDDYYRSSSSGSAYSSVHNRGTGSNSQDNTIDGDKDEAKCVLKIKREGKEEVLKIPCAIVSTFDNGNHTTNNAVNNATGLMNCSSLLNQTLEKSHDFRNETDSNEPSLFNVVSHVTINNDTLNNDTATNPCVNGTVDTDPLSVTGAPIVSADAAMACSVEIRTKQEVIQNNVDCEILLKYAKMSVPEDKVTNVLPKREALKAMLDKPPWWLSFLIAV